MKRRAGGADFPPLPSLKLSLYLRLYIYLFVPGQISRLALPPPSLHKEATTSLFLLLAARGYGL